LRIWKNNEVLYKIISFYTRLIFLSIDK
jgi:hypothetical protein